MIQFHCPDCNELLQVPDNSVGRKARCPRCQAIHVVTQPAPISIPSPLASESSTPSDRPTSPYGEEYTPAPPTDLTNPYASPGEAKRPDFGKGASNTSGYFPEHLLATRWQRFCGSIVDGLAYLGAGTPGFAGLMIMGASMENGGGGGDAADFIMFAALLLAIGGMLLAVCGNWYFIAQRGQSYGKMVMNTRIVRTVDHELPGFLYGVVLRNWLPVAINQACGVFSLVDACFVFGERRQCLHDLFASTQVIDANVDYRNTPGGG
ncbi:MAG: RDD family protein [Planctomycetales bacterium]|nr:RDD family protein [Planctomycetales bacterium]